MEQQEVKATSIFLSAAVVVPWRMVHSSTKLTVKKSEKRIEKHGSLRLVNSTG